MTRRACAPCIGTGESFPGVRCHACGGAGEIDAGALPAARALHFGNVWTESRPCDWGELAAACEDPDDGPRPVLPPVTAATLDEWAPGWRAAVLDDGDDDESDVLAHAAEAFARGELDGGDEWRDSFWPIMSFAWPVELHGLDAETAAERIAAFAPEVTLMRTPDDDGGEAFALALTAGGMDLSPALAAAYVACGAVPPVALLSRLRPGFHVSRAAESAVRAAMGRAAEFLEARAHDLRTAAKGGAA